MTPRSMRGFTLVELTIVLVIVALLTGGLMIAVGVQSEQRARSETQNLLLEAREALLGYAASHSALDGHPYLPCPDTNGDGLENRAANARTAQQFIVAGATDNQITAFAAVEKVIKRGAEHGVVAGVAKESDAAA